MTAADSVCSIANNELYWRYYGMMEDDDDDVMVAGALKASISTVAFSFSVCARILFGFWEENWLGVLGSGRGVCAYISLTMFLLLTVWSLLNQRSRNRKNLPPRLEGKAWQNEWARIILQYTILLPYLITRHYIFTIFHHDPSSLFLDGHSCFTSSWSYQLCEHRIIFWASDNNVSRLPIHPTINNHLSESISVG